MKVKAQWGTSIGFILTICFAIASGTQLTKLYAALRLHNEHMVKTSSALGGLYIILLITCLWWVKRKRQWRKLIPLLH